MTDYQEDYEEIDPDDSYYEVSNDNDSNINRGNSTGKQRPPKPSSKEGVESMRSYGSPALELESLDPTEEEVDDKAPTIPKEEILILEDLEDSNMHEEEEKSEDEDEEKDFDEADVVEEVTEEEASE